MVPKGHRLAARKAVVAARELADETLIGFEAHTPHGRIVENFFRQGGVTPAFSSSVRFAESACALAEQGNGIALVDEFTISGGVFPALVALPVKYRKPFRIHFHRLSAHPMSRAGARFRELLRQWQPAE
jgi:DNA-binding transcriptional LysR family regulator